jgi:hypothetical protein
MILKYGRSGAVLPSVAPGAQLYEQNSYRATAKQKGQLKEGRVKQGNACPLCHLRAPLSEDGRKDDAMKMSERNKQSLQTHDPDLASFAQ